MNFDDLIKKYRDCDSNRSFNIVLNEIAKYVMFEQAIVKKDNVSGGKGLLKYRYDEKSYKYIKSFFSKIIFLTPPVIGSGKEVVIKDLPEEYKYEMRHEMSFKDKIYILDKIKDSFMHLNGNDTMYDFDFNEKVVVIKNKGRDYSLECKIPFEALFKFNQYIKEEYDNSSPAIEWIDNFFNRGFNPNKVLKLIVDGQDLDYREIRVAPTKRVIYIPNTDCYYFFEKRTYKTLENISHGISKHDYDRYHTNSYVSLMKASCDGVNYPLLDSLYDFDFKCTQKEYLIRLKSIMDRLIKLYGQVIVSADLGNLAKAKSSIINSLYHNNNDEYVGLIPEISKLNNRIVGNYMRNARSHANNKGVPNCGLGNEAIMYYDVLYNSFLTATSEKNDPSFILFGGRKDLNNFFDELIDNSFSDEVLFDQINNSVSKNNYDLFELYLEQLNKILEQVKKDFASIDSSFFDLEQEDDKKNYEYPRKNKTYYMNWLDILSSSKGNSSNFIDYLRKVMNGTYLNEDVDVYQM